MGESILYLWVEKIREFLVEKSKSTDAGEAENWGWRTFYFELILSCVLTRFFTD